MRKALGIAAFLAALTLAAAACGGNNNESSGTAATAAPAGPTTTAAQKAGGTTVAVASSTLGNILVDGDGRTLYAFTKDKVTSQPAAVTAPPAGQR
jgi:predicted lipoprotein with Yx(FWY)xxD motif